MSSFIKLLKNKLVGAWPSNYSKPRRTVASELVVGLGGFEPPTSPLSGVRSNQLSYRPILASSVAGNRRQNQRLTGSKKGSDQRLLDTVQCVSMLTHYVTATFGLTPAIRRAPCSKKTRSSNRGRHFTEALPYHR